MAEDQEEEEQNQVFNQVTVEVTLDGPRSMMFYELQSQIDHEESEQVMIQLVQQLVNKEITNMYDNPQALVRALQQINLNVDMSQSEQE